MLLLALVVTLLARRNRTAAAFLLAAVVLAMVASHAPPAHAEPTAAIEECLGKADRTGDADLKKVVDFYRAHKGDIKIEDNIRNPKDPLYDSTLPNTPDHLYTPGKPTGSTIRWDPEQTVKSLSGGAMREKCSSLLHELFHAKEYLTGEAKGSRAICGPEATPLEVDEVKATHLENKYRGTLPKNSAGQAPTRATYDNKALPSQESCDKTTRVKPERPKPERKHEEQPEKDCEECAGSDGDPHLYTFDRRFYSFQAVGEFVLVKGDGMEIQVRQQPFEDSTTVSVNTAVAVSVAGQKRMISGAGQAEWPDGSAMWVTPIGAYGLRVQVLLADARKGKVSGLLGNYDGDKDNDVDLTEGTFGKGLNNVVKDNDMNFPPEWRLSRSGRKKP